MKETIRALRKVCDMTQTELAAKVGVTPQQISGVERGYKNMSLNSFEKIAIAFDIKAYELMSFVELEEKGATYEEIIEAFLEFKRRKDEEEQIKRKYKTMAKTLKAVRIIEEKTDKELAEAIGVHPLDIGFYESGKRRPDIAIIEKYAKGLNVQMEVIYHLLELENAGASFKEIIRAYLELEKQE